ncbi:MAG: hypothetical protein FE834_09860 [Gammaproteobacteria bacterium]|nr:hypothetical protein [Gammaproteobacteria bacterium]
MEYLQICEEAPKHNLPNSMLVPIAAKSIEDIKSYVGEITNSIVGRNGRVNAMKIKPYVTQANYNDNVPLWDEENHKYYAKQLFPEEQIWVHVDYTNYRNAYLKLSSLKIPETYILDHVTNRKAIKLKNYSHPFLRLCPISSKANSNSGGVYGMEGLEKKHLKSIDTNSEKFQNIVKHGIEYADPMDMTKMLNISTGTVFLSGVAKMLLLFYNE